MSSARSQDRWWSLETVAVVTGANKGIGFEIVRRLALEGLTVVLTARNESRGITATQELHAQGLDNVVFHQLDVSNQESMNDFADWIQETYCGLDILVNNAAVYHDDSSYENAVESMSVNYRGTIDVIEALLPMLKSSHAGARIVTLSSRAGLSGFRFFKSRECPQHTRQTIPLTIANAVGVQYLNDDNLRSQLMDATEFDEELLNRTAEEYLQACRNGEGARYANNSYRMSKALINGYLRLLTLRLANRRHGHKIHLHNTHPGLVQTDMYWKFRRQIDDDTYEAHVASGRFGSEQLIGVEEAAETPVWLCLTSDPLPSGRLWCKHQELSYI
nr:carbonyl reductase [NADPH] 1-like [Physcomitrium patens]|eukprot:XP_024389800.1 carbonyl reductase [NADPH] 1-like [Physcomitrella patens]